MLPVMALAVALQLQAPGDVRAMARDAWAGDTVDVLERRWLDALEVDPGDEIATLGLGFVYSSSYRYDEASERFKDLIGRPTTRLSVLAQAQYGLGAVSLSRGDFRVAAEALAGAGALGRTLGDSTLVGLALVGRAGAAARTLGRVEARTLMDSAGIWVPPGSKEYPLYLCSRGSLDTSVSIERMERAGERAGALGDQRVQGRCLFQIVVRLAARGATDSVEAFGERAVGRLTEARDLNGLSTALQWLGYYSRVTGAYDLAGDRLLRAVDIGEASRNRSAVAWSLVNLAAISSALGDVAAGIEYSRRATTMLEDQGDLVGLATVRGFEGSLWRTARDTTRERAAYEEGLAAARRLGDLTTIMGLEANLGSLAMRKGDLAEAEARFRTYERLVVDNGLIGWHESVQRQRAELAIAHDDLAIAESIFADLYPASRQASRQAFLLARWSEVRARMSDPDSAYVLASSAANVLDRFRASSTDDRLRLYALQREGGDRGVATTVNALTGVGRLDDAFELSERRRARELLDQMTRENALAGRPTRARSGSVVSLTDLRAALGDQTALLSYTTGEGEPTTLMLITADATTTYDLIPIDSLRSTIELLAAVAEQGSAFEAIAERLSRALLPSRLTQLPEGITRLVIVAEDVLHRLPFDLLPLSDDLWMVDRFAVSSAPSASIVHSLWQRGDRATTGAILAFGDPDRTDTPNRSAFARTGGLPRLPGSAREARAVGRYGVRSDVLTRGDASEAFLRTENLRDYEVIHFATHAIVDQQTSSRSAIALAPGRGEDGYMSPSELSELDLDTQLIVLSACRSGGGEIVRGEGLQGLTAPLLRAGARAVVATAWQIDDALVLAFIDDFYRALADGMVATDALRHAKLLARQSGQSPQTWAAFSLVGNERVRVGLQPRPSAGMRILALAVLVLFLVFVLGVLIRRARIGPERQTHRSAST